MRYLLTSSVTLFLAAPTPADVVESRWAEDPACGTDSGGPALKNYKMSTARLSKKILDILKKCMNSFAKQIADLVQLNYSCTSRTRHGVA